MAKVKISEFSTTAGNNTDINSINIAEGCAPSGINDAIRELMRQLKEFQTGGAGDSVNSGGDFSVATNKFTVASASGNTSVAGTLGVTGTTTLTGALVANGNATLGDASGDTVTIKGTPTLEVNPTLSGGTANGVLYLNGSKVATSGSALTFDGTYFTVGASATTGDYKTFIQKAGGELLGLNASSGTLTRIAFGNATASFGSTQIIANASDLAFITNSAEQMRVTSTGLGVGTSSPGEKLSVAGNASLSAAQPYISLIDSVWGAGTVIRSGVNTLGTATGNYQLFNVPTGKGFAFSQNNATSLAVLDSSGNLGLGVTPSAWNSDYKVEQFGATGFLYGRSGGEVAFGTNWYRDSGGTFRYLTSAAASYQAQASGIHYWFTAASGTADTAITFIQAMTLDASGNLLVGTTGSNGYRGDFLGTTTWGGLNVTGNSSGSYYTMNIDELGSGTQITVRINRSGTQVGSISTSASATAYNTSSDYRLKDNPQPLTGSGAFIDALKPKTWNWKADGSKGVGFIAHEVQEVSPGSVVGEKDGEQMQAMEYGSAEFIANIIAELQSLRARVATLES
jgi:hypothetical protein